MAKKKETTFEQYMKANEIQDKKYELWSKSEDRRCDILSRMSDCDTKLFKYNGVEYVVTKTRPANSWGSHNISIKEVQR